MEHGLGTSALPRVEGLVGRVIGGRWEILDRLASGATSVVFVARQVSLGRLVTLKVMQAGDAATAGAARRFEQEARAASSLNHPNTVTIHDFGTTSDGLVYIAMELLRGQTLRTHVARSAPLDLAETLDISQQICASLEDAHGHGIVHRDVKASNVFLSRQEGGCHLVKLLDFGFARNRDATWNERATLPGWILGTPPYMSPEATRGEDLDARSDIYSFGILLFEMLTGVLPYTARTLRDLLTLHRSAPIPHPSDRVPGLLVHPSAAALLPRLLAKDPDDRPESMTEVIEALHAVREEGCGEGLDQTDDVLVELCNEEADIEAGTRAALVPADPPAPEEVPDEDEDLRPTAAAAAPCVSANATAALYPPTIPAAPSWMEPIPAASGAGSARREPAAAPGALTRDDLDPPTEPAQDPLAYRTPPATAGLALDQPTVRAGGRATGTDDMEPLRAPPALPADLLATLREPATAADLLEELPPARAEPKEPPPPANPATVSAMADTTLFMPYGTRKQPVLTLDRTARIKLDSREDEEPGKKRRRKSGIFSRE